MGLLGDMLEAFNEAGRKSRERRELAKGLLGLTPGSALHQYGQELMGNTAGGIAEGFVGPAAIKAYHGSPHLFDKFSMNKIGTGEGAQAYGHGLYFAENPKVAKSYHDTLAPIVTETPEGVLSRGRGGTPQEQAAAWLEQQHILDPGNELEGAIAHLKSNIAAERRSGRSTEWEKSYTDALRVLEDWKARGGVKVGRGGGLYEIDLRWPNVSRETSDPLLRHHFLDWDAPLSKQSPYVQAAASADTPMTGAQLYNEMALATSRKRASDVLKRSGLAGIRYRDAGSRGGPMNPIADGYYANKAGTSNYVAFDDALIEILKRNGVPVK